MADEENDAGLPASKEEMLGLNPKIKKHLRAERSAVDITRILSGPEDY
jgi:hypothetical protein